MTDVSLSLSNKISLKFKLLLLITYCIFTCSHFTGYLKLFYLSEWWQANDLIIISAWWSAHPNITCSLSSSSLWHMLVAINLLKRNSWWQKCPEHAKTCPSWQKDAWTVKDNHPKIARNYQQLLKSVKTKRGRLI